MTKKDKLKEKILKLNKAWKKIRSAIVLLKEAFKKDNEVDIYIYLEINKGK